MEFAKGPGETKVHDGSSLRIAIVHARWNATIVNALVAGARKSLHAAGVREENIVVVDVPGSYELPYAVQRLYAASQVQSSTSATTSSLSANDLLSSASQVDLTSSSAAAASTSAFDAMVAIGVLIKGETMHFEYIADATANGLMRIQLDSGVPVIFGLLTVLNEEQALARAGIHGDGHCHGEDWGAAAVELGVKRRAWGKGKVN